MNKDKLQNMEYKLSEEYTVSGFVYGIFRTSQLLGMAPVRFEMVHGSWRVRALSTLSPLVYAVIIIPSAFMFIYAEASGTMAKIPKNMQVILWLTNFFLSLIAACIMRYTAAARTKKFIICLLQTEKIKSSLKNVTFNKLSTKTTCVSFSALISITLMTFGFDLYDTMMRYQGNAIVTIIHALHILNVLMLFMTLLHFVTVVLKIYTILQSINDTLQKLLLRCRGTCLIGGGTDSMDDIIRNLNKGYGAVCNVVEKLNAASGCTNITILLICCFTLTCTPYIIIVDIVSNTFSIHSALSMGNWYVMYFFWLLAMIEPCHKTHGEMQRTSNLISKLLMRSTNEPTRLELVNFHDCILVYNVSYTPMDICTLSRSLIAHVTATVTTYLVMFIQFQMLDGSIK